jgi:hypothetical protein
LAISAGLPLCVEKFVSQVIFDRLLPLGRRRDLEDVRDRCRRRGAVVPYEAAGHERFSSWETALDRVNDCGYMRDSICNLNPALAPVCRNLARPGLFLCDLPSRWACVVCGWQGLLQQSSNRFWPRWDASLTAAPVFNRLE